MTLGRLFCDQRLSFCRLLLLLLLPLLRLLLSLACTAPRIALHGALVGLLSCLHDGCAAAACCPIHPGAACGGCGR